MCFVLWLGGILVVSIGRVPLCYVIHFTSDNLMVAVVNSG